MSGNAIALLAGTCTIVGALIGIVAGFYMAMNKFVTKEDLNNKCNVCRENQSKDEENLRAFITDVKRDFQRALDEMKKDFKGWLGTLKEAT